MGADGHAFSQALAAKGDVREQAGQDGAHQTANGVHSEDVKRVIVSSRTLELGGGQEAQYAGNDAQEQGAHRTAGA